jgi:hypothetical protein
MKVKLAERAAQELSKLMQDPDRPGSAVRILVLGFG